jgi:hypothetical protein
MIVFPQVAGERSLPSVIIKVLFYIRVYLQACARELPKSGDCGCKSIVDA